MCECHLEKTENFMTENTASSYFLVGVRVRVRVIFRKSFLILKRVKNCHVRNATSETYTRETATRTVTEIVASNIRHMFKNFFKKKNFYRPTDPNFSGLCYR